MTERNVKKACLTVLGARGSMPGEGKSVAIYGGSTSCYRFKAGDEEIFLDAGSGIAGVKTEKSTNIYILFTHLHLDHIVGLPFFSPLGEKNRKIIIYGKERSNLTLKMAVDRLITPPFWPVNIEGYPATVKFCPIIEDQTVFSLGKVTVETMEGNHPGGSTVYKLTYNDKSIVYATDFEHNSKTSVENLTKFANNAELFLYDAQYTVDEYQNYMGYGHSTPEAGFDIAKKANVKTLVFVHHAPYRSDTELEKMQNLFSNCKIKTIFAKIGDEFYL